MRDHGVAGSSTETQAAPSADYENLEGFFPHFHGGEYDFMMNPGGAPRPPFGWMGRGRGRRFGAAMMFGPNMFPGMPRGGRRGFGGRGRGRGGFGRRRWMEMVFDDDASVSSMTNHFEDCNIEEEGNNRGGDESASSISSASSSSSSSESESETEDDVVRRKGKKSKKPVDANQPDKVQGEENEGEANDAELDAGDRDNATNGRDSSRDGGRGKHGKRHRHGNKHHHGHGRRHHHLPPFNPMIPPPPPPHHGFFHGQPPHHPPPPGFGYHNDLRHVRKFKKSMKKWRKAQNKMWKLRAKMMARHCMPEFDYDGTALEGEFDFQLPPPWVFHQRRCGGHGRRRFCCCADKEERRKRHGKRGRGRPGDEKPADGTSGDVIDVEDDAEQTPMEEINEQAAEATGQINGSAQ